jgi:hypothetical protein
MHAHTLGCMEACAICGDIQFVVLRRSSHTTAPTHLLQHLFAVIAQRLARDEDDRSLGLRARTDGKARTVHAHGHVQSAHDMVRPQSPLLLLRTLSMKAAACLMMMWVRSSRTQMMTRKIMGGGCLQQCSSACTSCITVVELGVIHLVHVASQIWTQGDVHRQGPRSRGSGRTRPLTASAI